MTIIELKKTLTFQPEIDMCVSSCIKNVLDSQFHSKRYSLKKINKCLRYINCLGVGLDSINNLNELLNKDKIYVFQKDEESNNIKSIERLIERKIYPIVIFPLKDYEKWKNDKTRVYSDGDENTYHFLVVVGIDRKDEIVYVFDPIKNKYRDYDKEPYDKITFSKFYNVWVHEEDILYPIIWFERKNDNLNIDPQQKTVIDKFDKSSRQVDNNAK
ncbi:MAG: hypothetical protein DRN71_02245 [Candidatus Nanohalarchaeota archaeon]|nr:MAG: hypothetical protein DRN71_02245 [Candidatus Nanohaloarchaeota archaeon]